MAFIEFIRSKYPDVDRLIANGKKIFRKSPARVQVFKEHAPGVPLPAQPVLTRWGTWLEAVTYYSQHFEQFQEVLTKLDVGDAPSIDICVTLLKDKNIKNKIAFIAANYGEIPVVIKKLELKGDPLVKSFEILRNLEKNISEVGGEMG